MKETPKKASKKTSARDLHAERILILDFGSQYTQLIARRVREQKVYCEIWPCTAAGCGGARLRARGASSSRAGRRPSTSPRRRSGRTGIFELGVPVLGICYGMQLMAHQLGGEVAKAAGREYGRAHLRIARPGALQGPRRPGEGAGGRLDGASRRSHQGPGRPGQCSGGRLDRHGVQQPFTATDTLGAFDVKARVVGGGLTGQAGAMRLGIARALVLADDRHRKKLREQGLLTRDPRAVERKKPGRAGARKRFQFSKR